MNRIKFSNVANGTNANMTFLVSAVIGKVDSKGHDFVDVTGSDGEQSVSLKLWNTSLPQSGITAGDVLDAVVESREYRGSTSYSIRTYSKSQDSSPSDFLITPPVPIDEMFSWVKQRILSFKEPYKEIATKLVISNGKEYMKSAAGSSVHHAFLGGLLYHSYRMAKAGELLSSVYQYDRDLVVCGCLLHDIGKLKEMSTDWTGHAEYTVEGQIENHLQIGARMVEEAARETGTAESEQVKMLVHVIASHHGTREMGALHVPMTREAMLVHQLDVMDMQQEICDECLPHVGKGQFTMYEAGRLGHKLYRPNM